MTVNDLSQILKNFPSNTVILIHVEEGKFAQTELIGHGIYDPKEAENRLTESKYIEQWNYEGGKVLRPRGSAINLIMLGPCSGSSA